MVENDRRFQRDAAVGHAGEADVERAADLEIFSLVVEHVHLVGVEIQPLFDVAHEGVVGDRIP